MLPQVPIDLGAVVPGKKENEALDVVSTEDTTKTKSLLDKRRYRVRNLAYLSAAPLGDIDIRIRGVALIGATLVVGAVTLQAAVPSVMGRNHLVGIGMMECKKLVTEVLPAVAGPERFPLQHPRSVPR